LGERTGASFCSTEQKPRTRVCGYMIPRDCDQRAGHNNCSSALVGGYG
jgi:hypothetical protein